MNIKKVKDLVLSKKIIFGQSLLILVLMLYSFYTILFSTAHVAQNLLVIFALLSLFVAFLNGIDRYVIYIKWLIIFLVLYFLMSYISTYVSSSYADKQYLFDTFPNIILASIIPIGFYNIKNININFIRWGLVFMLAFMLLSMFLFNNGYLHINGQSLFGEMMIWNNWTQKNYMFWYVLCMWGTISFFDIRKLKDFIVIVLIISCSLYILKDGYSESAKAALYLGLVMYILFSVVKFNKKILYIFISLFTLYIILSPIIFSFIDLIGFHHRLVYRLEIYHTAVEFIKNSPIFGYGFGSTLTLKLDEVIDTSHLVVSWVNFFKGGHPHNLSLLFWIEFGIFGALFLSYFVHRLLKYFIANTYLLNNQASLFAMILSMDIITSFSWSIWYTQVLLTYSFFVVLLVLSIQNRTMRKV